MLLALAACEEPGILDSVAEELALRTAAEAEDGVRLVVAVSGLVAETCGVEDVDTYTFAGGGAAALGATVGERLGGESFTWVFAGVGLDGVEGELHLSTDAAREDYTVSWEGDGDALTAALTLAWCDPSALEAVVSGTGHHVTQGDDRNLALDGPSPYPGLRFEPTTGIAPTSGFVTWSWHGEDARDGNGDDRKIVLDDASTIDVDAGLWSGTASGNTWSHAIELALP